MIEEVKTPDLLEEERNAIDLIAHTPEGLLLHRYLRRILETVYEIPLDRALQSAEGRRTLARDLMRLMAAGIEATSDRTGTADRAILSGNRSAIDAGSRRRGTERRVTLEPGDGWLPADRYPASKS